LFLDSGCHCVECVGIVDALVQIPRREGVLAFWRGNATNCGRYFFTQALTFCMSDFFLFFYFFILFYYYVSIYLIIFLFVPYSYWLSSFQR
jgi:hypothetical protein